MVRQFNTKCLRILVIHLSLIAIGESKKSEKFVEDCCLPRNSIITSLTFGNRDNLNSFVSNESKFFESNLSVSPSASKHAQRYCLVRSPSSVNNRCKANSHIDELNLIETTNNNSDDLCEKMVVEVDTGKQHYEVLYPGNHGKRIVNKVRRLLQIGALEKMNRSLRPNAGIRNDRAAVGASGTELPKKMTSGLDMSKNCQKRRYRPVKSIEDIWDLTEKLVVKVSQLHNYLTLEKNGEDQMREGRRNRQIYIRKGRGRNEKGLVPRRRFPISDHSHSKEEKSSTGKTVDKPFSVTSENRIIEGMSCRSGRNSALTTSITTRSRTETKNSNGIRRIDRRWKRRSRRRWDRWTDWSSCSVTCGKGRQIRWRYCIRDCGTAESEMEAKDCQLPACAPSKFLGIF